jgi:hypothetical protein
MVLFPLPFLAVSQVPAVSQQESFSSRASSVPVSAELVAILDTGMALAFQLHPDKRVCNHREFPIAGRSRQKADSQIPAVVRACQRSGFDRDGCKSGMAAHSRSPMRLACDNRNRLGKFRIFCA